MQALELEQEKPPFNRHEFIWIRYVVSQMLCTFKVTFQPPSRSLWAKEWRQFQFQWRQTLAVKTRWRPFEFYGGKTITKRNETIRAAVNWVKFNSGKCWWCKEVLLSVHGTRGYAGMQPSIYSFHSLRLILELYLSSSP